MPSLPSGDPTCRDCGGPLALHVDGKRCGPNPDDNAVLPPAEGWPVAPLWPVAPEPDSFFMTPGESLTFEIRALRQELAAMRAERAFEERTAWLRPAQNEYEQLTALWRRRVR